MVSQWVGGVPWQPVRALNNHISVFFFRNIFVRILFFLTTTEQRVFVKNGQTRTRVAQEGFHFTPPQKQNAAELRAMQLRRIGGAASSGGGALNNHGLINGIHIIWRGCS